MQILRAHQSQTQGKGGFQIRRASPASIGGPGADTALGALKPVRLILKRSFNLSL